MLGSVIVELAPRKFLNFRRLVFKNYRRMRRMASLLFTTKILRFSVQKEDNCIRWELRTLYIHRSFLRPTSLASILLFSFCIVFFTPRLSNIRVLLFSSFTNYNLMRQRRTVTLHVRPFKRIWKNKDFEESNYVPFLWNSSGSYFMRSLTLQNLNDFFRI
jgi:hypothetical protein